MAEFSVCVYCASSEAVAGAYRRVAAELGRAIAAARWRLVYGGGGIGLMGEVARACLTAGGHVTGIIPDRLATREIAFDEVSELHVVHTMRERKALMDERSDAFVVLPGGIGTLEELVEMLTLKQLGYHDRAVVLLDAEGYWDPLIAQFRRMVEGRFADDGLLGLFTVAQDVEQTMAALRAYTPRHSEPTAPEVLESVEGPPGERGKGPSTG